MADHRIRFVYFDLGNVLVHFDPEIACRQLAKTLQSDPTTIRCRLYESGLETQLEAGRITEDEFLETLLDSAQPSARRDEVFDAMSNMFWVNVSIVPVVAKLMGSGFMTGLLSNTCSPHWNWITRQKYGIVRTIGQPTVLSYEVGSMKPDQEIYAVATATTAVSPSEILFIDDRQENVDAAIEHGWNGIRYTDSTDLVRRLREIGVNCFT